MSVVIQIHDDGRGVHLVATGDLCGARLASEFEAFLRDRGRELSGVRYWYSDYTGVGAIDVETVELRRIATACKDLARALPQLAVAIVADRDVAFGLARMFEALADETAWEFHVCRSQDEARAWLGEQLGLAVSIPGSRGTGG